MQRTKHLLQAIAICLLLVACLPSAEAQTYKHGLGLRLGPSYGLTYKSFLSEKLALEALFSSRYYGRGYGYYNGSGKKPKYWANSSGPGATLGALLEYHLPFPDVSELQWCLVYWRRHTYWLLERL